MVCTEIYCENEHSETVQKAIMKLAGRHPEWRLDVSLDWEEVEEHPLPWTVKRHDLKGQAEMEAVIVEDDNGNTLATHTVLKGSLDDETALALAEDDLQDED